MKFIRKNWKWLVVMAVTVMIVARFKLAPVPVQVHEVRAGVVLAEVMGTGTLEARVKTTISPRLQERLAAVLVDQGDSVKAGQLLARLDDGELRGLVDVAEASLAATQATARRVQVDESRAQAVEQQAQQDHQRIAELVGKQISSQSELDKAVEKLRVAESDLQRVRAATIEAQQQVITAEKNLAHQQERLSFAQMVSPYDGLITRRDRDPGGVVVPGSSLLQLISTNELWVSAWVDEVAAAALATGQTAQVLFRSQPERSYAGELARLGRETDRETREFLVDVRVQELPPNWTIGQRAEVFIETGRKTDALTVPQRFLRWRDDKPSVFVSEGGTVTSRDVTLGLHGRDAVEITKGLSAGEKVVAPANPKQPPLKPGQRVAAK